MNPSSRAYLSVISWPDHFDESARVSALVECSAMDPYLARLASRRNLPGVMCVIDASVRPHILNALHARGIMCIAPTHTELNQYPQAQNAIGVDQFPDADPPSFVVENPNNQHWTFDATQVRLIIAGHIKSTTTRIRSNPSIARSAFAAEQVVINSLSGDGVQVSRNTTVTQLLDLHVMSKSGLQLVRLVGPRTRIGIVGDESRPSLLDDSRPVEMASILMPGVMVDTGFGEFDPPGDVRAKALKNGRQSGSLTIDAWAFYSPWVAMIAQSMENW